jgi:hypothetical protein
MFLGQHTIAETNALIADVDHRFTKVDEAFDQVMNVMKMTGPDAELWKKNWSTLKSKWSRDKLAMAATFAVQKATSGFLADDKMPAESAYQTILGYVEKDSGDPNLHPTDSLRGLQLNIEGSLGHPIDIDTGRPALINPPVPDPDEDFLQNKSVEAAAKAGEKILNAAGIQTDAGCTPEGQAAIRGALASQGIPGPAIDLVIKQRCSSDHTIRNIAIGVGLLVALSLGIQIFAPALIAVRSLTRR